MPRTALTLAAAAPLAAIALLPLAASAAPAQPAIASAPTAATKIGTVYQGKTVNRSIVLGPQSKPTLLTQTPRLPAGTYLVTAIVGATIASHDQIACSAFPAGNDGVFGTAGNAGTGSIFGTAAMTDTVRVSAGQQIKLVCNSFNFGLGTTAGGAVVEAIPVSHVK
jgi:hypothetical protein